MTNNIYILAKASGDDEYDDISYAYITLLPGAYSAVRKLGDVFAQAASMTPTLLAMDFYAPEQIHIEYLGDDANDELADHDFGEERFVVLGGPLDEDLIAECEPEWLTGGDRIHFHTTLGDFSVQADYKHAVGSVTAWHITFGKMREICEGGDVSETSPKLLQGSKLRDGFHKFGNKGCIWSNAAAEHGIHIARNGESRTLCGAAMLAHNWANSDNGLGTEYDYETIGCRACREDYRTILETEGR